MRVILLSWFILTLTCVYTVPISKELTIVVPTLLTSNFSNGFQQDQSNSIINNVTATVLMSNKSDKKSIEAKNLLKNSIYDVNMEVYREHFRDKVILKNLTGINKYIQNNTSTNESTIANQTAIKATTILIDEIAISQNTTDGNNSYHIPLIETNGTSTVFIPISTENNTSTLASDLAENVTVTTIPVHVLIDSFADNTSLFYNKTENITNTTTPVNDVKENVTEANLYNTLNATFSNEVQVIEAADISINNLILRSNLNAHMRISNYAVTITPDVATNRFTGSLTVTAVLTQTAMIAIPISFYVKGLTISSVTYAVGGGSTYSAAIYSIDLSGNLVIVSASASLYSFKIDYTGVMDTAGSAMYHGNFGNTTYVAMNLYPANARRVFPCIDELSEESAVSITLNNAATGYSNVIGNSIHVSNTAGVVQLTSLSGLLHKWGMVAHNFVHLNNPVTNGKLFVRSGITNQDSQAAVIINYVFTEMQNWTNKVYTEIIANQEGFINFIAMPDITKDWVALSTVPIWEPHVLMLSSHAVAQRKTAMIEISKGISRQWFGYVIHPEDWRYQWIVEGIGSHVAYEMARKFQGQATDIDNTVIDIDSIFVSEVIQEAMLRDSYQISAPIEPNADILLNNLVREHVNGIIKYKAPAIIYMVKNILGAVSNVAVVDGVTTPEDYIQTAARALLASRSLQSVNRLNLIDAINSDWTTASTKLIDDFAEFLAPWILNNSYPVINVQLRTSGVIVTQSRFGFSSTSQVTYTIPITYTTSVNPNFNDTTVGVVMDNNLILDLYLDADAEDWVIFNLQGQGYYRVNYDTELWERLIIALSDPDTREVIHPINRATLLDDALNLARAGDLDYDIALRIVLTMEHETEYVVWKAFIRNMDFIKKRLVAAVTEDDDDALDPDIYLRMVRRTITAVETQLSFYPDTLVIENAMTSMARGIAMEHACKANYDPCIAAAIDWFYDPSSTDLAINSNIPHDIRPAVYCAVVMNGDETARDLLRAQIDTTSSMYERLVMVKALACSQDETFLLEILNSAISDGAGLGVAERVQFFISMTESSYTNALLALRFIRENTIAMRTMFGGAENIEEMAYVLAQNMATADMTSNYDIWVNSINSGLDDSVATVTDYSSIANENLVWNTAYMTIVYDWIDENDATTSFISFSLIIASLLISMFHY